MRVAAIYDIHAGLYTQRADQNPRRPVQREPKVKLVELASPRFVQTHAGVLLIGPPGVGKSHLATAIAVGAIRAGRRVLTRSTFAIAAEDLLEVFVRRREAAYTLITTNRPTQDAREVVEEGAAWSRPHLDVR